MTPEWRSLATETVLKLDWLRVAFPHHDCHELFRLIEEQRYEPEDSPLAMMPAEVMFEA